MGFASRKPELWVNHPCLVCSKPIIAHGGHYHIYCSNKCHAIAQPLPKKKMLPYSKWRDKMYIRDYMILYAIKHRDKLNLLNKKWNREHPDLRKYIKRKWQKNNLDKVRLLNYHRSNIKSQGVFTLSDWLDIKQRYNNSCACCGISEATTKLEIDHILPLSKGGVHRKDNIQPLCRSCNSSKGNKYIKYEPSLVLI